jgi:regulator of protease activity HflC (stomatin/prohibitin superfamily)
MSDIDDLRAELDRQRAEQERRHQALLSELQRRDARPPSAADARATIRNGYAQSEAEREAAKVADGEGGDAQ